jgi:hypothetical protein
MGNAMNKEADWIPLMDYAIKNGVSLSTLRRHIKANKIQYKVENGRYLLRSMEGTPSFVTPEPMRAAMASSDASPEVRELRARLQNAQEEIAELKMLVALYEEQLAQVHSPRPGHPLRVNG